MKYNRFEVGQAVRKLREDNGMSLYQLSQKVDRCTGHLNMIELGTRNMSFELLYLLMTVFHTDANSILGVAPAGVNKEVSIDNRLMQLNPSQRAYFTDAFLHMLDKAPVMMGGCQ